MPTLLVTGIFFDPDPGTNVHGQEFLKEQLGCIGNPYFTNISKVSASRAVMNIFFGRIWLASLS